jgi:hypothetical protein
MARSIVHSTHAAAARHRRTLLLRQFGNHGLGCDVIWTDSVPDFIGRVLLFSPAIGAYFLRQHFREKAYQKRMADPKNWPTRTG